jgi:putative membrane protein
MLRIVAQAGEWVAAHPHENDWAAQATRWVPWLGACAVLALVLRALAQAQRYRAVGVLTDADIEAVHEEVRQAERRTVGEIVPVVVERSDDHPHAGLAAALLFALGGAALLAAQLPWHAPELVLLAQLGLALAGWTLCRSLPGFARLFVGEARATHVAAEQALQEFAQLGLRSTAAESGVLIFVSLFERRVVVLGDRGVDARVGSEHWKAIDAAVRAGVRRGSLRTGLIDGIRLAGVVLAEHFPSVDGERNELPDRVVVRAR